MKGNQWLIILLLGLFIMLGCKQEEETTDEADTQNSTSETEDTLSPAATNKTITVTNLTAGSLTLNWSKATDNADSQSTLLYRVYLSESDNLGSLSETVTNGTALNTATADLTSYNVTDLQSSRPYTFNVVVMDSQGNSAVYDSVTVTTMRLLSAGSYVDNWKGTHLISATKWINGLSSYTVSKVDTTNDFLIAENDPDHPYNPGKFSRFDWARDATGDLYFCQSAYDKGSAAEAEAVTSADDSDLTGSGCGGFSWSKLIPFTDVSGDYVDAFKTPHSIDAVNWVNGMNEFRITKIDASNDYLIAKNDSANPYNPDKYSRFDWAFDATGDAYYCQIAYDSATPADAEAVTTADASDLAGSGCGGFSWSKLNRFSEIGGFYVDSYKGAHGISSSLWLNGASSYSITKIDSSNDYMIGRNGDANPYNPGKYSRLDWTSDPSGDLYYCQSAYDKDSAAEAEQVSAPDSSDPANKGCGISSFPWTKLTAFTELKGNFVDNYSGSHTIASGLWISGDSTFRVEQIDTSNDCFIAKNAADNSYYPNLFSRFDWTVDGSGETYYCQSAYDKSSASEAASVAAPDASNPGQSGCGAFDFAWTRLTSFSELQ